jgi:hypothetical protein
MPILNVLINNKGEVVGTARTDVTGAGKGAPQRVAIAARSNQRLIDVTIDDRIANLDSAALHAAIKAKLGNKGRGKSLAGRSRRKAHK